MSLVVQSPGLFTTVQDAGRFGWRRFGVVVGGPMDADSFAAANALVGNVPGAAALEMTLAGGTFALEADALIAVCGADMAPTVDGAPLPMWRPVRVPAGATIRFGAAARGRYAYLAAAGGIRVPEVLGSRSASTRGPFPGLAGRILQAGDALPIEPHPPLRGGATAADRPYRAPRWLLGEGWRFAAPDAVGERVVRALRGREWDRFDAETRRRIETGDWTFVVRAESDRMGYRLDPDRAPTAARANMLSEAVAPGTIQVPPDGRPIALMADSQTTGGYPRLLQVCAVDLGLLAQTRPGGVVRVRLIEHEQAVELWLDRARQWRWLRERLRWTTWNEEE
ncbi:biotin-dependent carboxyltransferase family protein [Paenibacillus sp.]|uniref:5-oxoprolinase subunit C family protein n=1 Tax=Paenibacillus sp. TaxID=58172 RepID=UPI002D42E6AC|nr:biotin-dependent carboxyltransferase family protein [Paenibacillus sp.]HZG85085.1 biotin-dependent carboxyltransferase family protein [Paenibacillus sp.]